MGRIYRNISIFFTVLGVASCLAVLVPKAPVVSAAINCPPNLSVADLTDRRKDNDDQNKCYSCIQEACIGFSYPNDGLSCPPGLYRGITRGQESSKCYHCTPSDCNEAGRDVSRGAENDCPYVNGKVDQKCVNDRQRESDEYEDDLTGRAPNDYYLPELSVVGSSTAKEYCKYYKQDEEDRYDTSVVVDACIMGYEVGYGNNMICTARYLGITPPPDQGKFTNSYAKSVHMYLAGIKNNGDKTTYSAADYPDLTYRSGTMNAATGEYAKALRDLVAGRIMKACRDGYSQYVIDYYYCNKDKSCIDRLRTDKRRLFDPGKPGLRTVPGDEGTGAPRVAPQVTGSVAQRCGGVNTAYFTCSTGDTVATSALWQLAQIIMGIITGIVGLLAIGGIVWGATRYASSADNAAEQNAAKEFIRNVIIGLVLFLAMWAIIEYIIPGGVFS